MDANLFDNMEMKLTREAFKEVKPQQDEDTEIQEGIVEFADEMGEMLNKSYSSLLNAIKTIDVKPVVKMSIDDSQVIRKLNETQAALIQVQRNQVDINKKVIAALVFALIAAGAALAPFVISLIQALI